MTLESSRKALHDALDKLDAKQVDKASVLLITALRSGKKILACGNGGSAADAQHLAAELSCTFEDKHRRALPAIALTANTSVLTAWGNDFGFDTVFSRQVEALGATGDVLVSFTTSGNSKNVLEAMRAAKAKGMKNLLFTGRGGGPAAPLADLAVVIVSDRTPRIQECHEFVMHEICAKIDEEFAGSKK